ELLAVAIGPEQVGAALHHRDDVLVLHVGLHPLPLAPHAGAVREGGAQVALVEELDPRGRAALLEGLEVVHDLEQVAALRALVDDLVERVVAVTPGDAAEDGARLAGRGHEGPPRSRPCPPRTTCDTVSGR